MISTRLDHKPITIFQSKRYFCGVEFLLSSKPVVIVLADYQGGYSLIWSHCVREVDMILNAFSLKRVYNFTFYNKRLEQDVDLFGPGMGRLAVSRLHLWYRQLYFFERNLTLGCLLRN